MHDNRLAKNIRERATCDSLKRGESATLEVEIWIEAARLGQ